jgi:hypothetical protein
MSKAAWKRVAFLRLGACVAPVALLELSLFHAPRRNTREPPFFGGVRSLAL